jgi:hypothetical protein
LSTILITKCNTVMRLVLPRQQRCSRRLYCGWTLG